MEGMSVLGPTVADAVAMPMRTGEARDYRTGWLSQLRPSARKSPSGGAA